jgi:homoserine kinase
MERRRLVRVPASSANLGPGFDVLAAALSLHLDLEVAEAREFSVDTGGLAVPEDRTNLCVRAFERLHPADGLAFSIRSEIPLASGLGSSAAAIVAGLFAAEHLYELALSKDELLAQAAELEGHPDNVAAAIYGGFVICGRQDGDLRPVRIDPPSGIEAVLVVPKGGELATEAARQALPEQVPLADAVENLASASLLVLGLAREDPGLIARGLADRLHQPHRAGLYPRSVEVVSEASNMGALGATISGAGPSVLVWSFWQDTGKVVASLSERFGDWADVRRAGFSALGADVPEL